jgi:hypothetical protein
LIEFDGVCGVTSNPSIFQKAISQTAAYATLIGEYTRRGMSPEQVYEALTLNDIRTACDLLAPVYERTQARDGYVSLEVNPHLAHDADATLLEARRLFSVVSRPNFMIKIPATVQCLPAITRAIAEGINVNVTLIFSVERYAQVLDAWLRGLEAAADGGTRTLGNIASVASFFISRVDTAVDAVLEALGPEHGPCEATLQSRTRHQRTAAFLKCATGPVSGSLLDAERRRKDRCARAPARRAQPTVTSCMSRGSSRRTLLRRYRHRRWRPFEPMARVETILQVPQPRPTLRACSGLCLPQEST